MTWTGRWFLPANPAIQVVGTLHMADGSNSRLELFGSFDDRVALIEERGIQIVHGISTEGLLLTAETVGEASVGTSRFGVRRSYYVRRVIKGDLLPDLDPEVLSVEFGLSRLHDWILPEVFNVERHFDNFPYGAKFVLRYEDPAPVTLYRSDELDIHMQFWAGLPFVSPRSRSECLHHFSGLRIDAHKPTKLSRLLPIVGQARALLSFATSVPNIVTYLAAHRGRDDSAPLQKRVVPRERLDFFPVDNQGESVGQDLYPERMLFTFNDDLEEGGVATAKWFGGWSRIGTLIKLFLGANHAADIYGDVPLAVENHVGQRRPS